MVLNNILSGQQRRVYDLVVGLSNEFEVEYIEITDLKDSLSEEKFINTGVRYTKYKLGYTKFIKVITGVLHAMLFPFFGVKKSLIVGYFWSLKNRKLLRSSNFDVVICEYFMMSFIFKYLSKDTCKIIDMHDIQFVTLESSFVRKNGMLNKSKLYFARKIEIAMLRSADALISVNTNEIEVLKGLGVEKKYFFVPLTIADNGLKEYTLLRNMEIIHLSYFAGLSTQRSFYELRFILQELLTPVFEKFGNDLRLFVFGNNPSREIIDLCHKFENVILIGQIENIQESFKNIHFSISYWLGMSYGFRTRIIDVLACGVPFFLNQRCIEGMGLPHFDGLKFVDSGSDIIEAIEYYKERPSEYKKVCEEALQASRMFSRSAISKKFNIELATFLNQLDTE